MKTTRPVPFVVFLAVTVVSLVTAAAQSRDRSAPPKADDAGKIEEIQEVAAVETPSRPAGLILLGRMHPALVHFPIGWVLLLLLVEAVAAWTGKDEWSRVGMFILVLACVSFVPAAITGFLRAAAMGDDPEFRSLMMLHRNLNVAAGISCLGALTLRVGWAGNVTRAARWTYVALVACSAGLLSIAGHLGGKMVFGPEYLPF